MTALYVGTTNNGTSAGGTCSFRVQTAFDVEACEQYGAAAAAWTTIDIVAAGASGATTISVEYGMFNKTTTRLPEAMFMQFQTVR
jgi:hypothetical protein